MTRPGTRQQTAAPEARPRLAHQGVRAVRVLYPDLHGVARGKDIPLRHFPALADGGRHLLRRRDGHRPPPHAGRRRRGGLRRPRRAPGPRHAARRPVAARGRVVPRRGVHARRLEPVAGLPARAARARRRAPTRSAACDPSSRPSSSSSSSSATRMRRTATRRYVDELSRVYTVGAVSDPRRPRAADAALVRRARARGVRREPRVHELAVRDQREALGRARRRRPRLHAEGGGEGDRGPRGSRSRRSWADRSPTRAAPGSTSTSRSPTATAAERVRRRGRSRRAEPARARASSRACSSTRRACRRCSGPTVNAYKRILPDSLAPDPRELGSRQPHRVLPRPERARRRARVEIRTRRRRRERPPDRRGDPARGARRDRARARAAGAGRRRRLPHGRRPRRHAAPGATSAPRSTRSRRTTALVERLGGARRRRSSR